MGYGTPEDSRLPQTDRGGWPPLSVAHEPSPTPFSCFKGRPGVNYSLIAAYTSSYMAFYSNSHVGWALLPGQPGAAALFLSFTVTVHPPHFLQSQRVTQDSRTGTSLWSFSPSHPAARPSLPLHSLRQLSFNFHVICIYTYTLCICKGQGPQIRENAIFVFLRLT